MKPSEFNNPWDLIKNMTFNKSISFAWNEEEKKATIVILGEEFKMFFKDFITFYNFQKQLDIFIKMSNESLLLGLIDKINHEIDAIGELT